MSLKSFAKNLIRRQPNWLTVNNSAEAADLVIDGPIGKSWYDDSGVCAKEFRNALNAIPKGKPINVRINSEGGAIGDGLAIYNLLQERKDSVTCFVDGYALSSASFIALAGGRTIAPKSSILMAHLPWTMTAGDDAAHAKAAEMLKVHGDVIAGIYSDKTGKPKADMLDLMKKETWIGGAEAVSMGFADATSTDQECPKCDHELCDECEQEGGNITCSECGETSPSTEWDDGDESAENSAKAKVSALGARLKDHEKGLYNERVQELYQNVPCNIFNMLRPGQIIDQAHAETPSAVTPDSGAAGTAASNSETQNSMKENEKTPVAAASVAAPVTAEQFAVLNAKFENERKLRIEARVDTFIGECRITNEERADAVNRAIADESYLNVIGKRPAMSAGGAPLGMSASGVEVMDDVFKQIKAEKNPLLRQQMRRNDWSNLYLHAKSMDARQAGIHGASDLMNLPVNANSIASALVVDYLADSAITSLVNVLPPLRAFTRDFAPSPLGPLGTVQVRLVTKGGGDQQATKLVVGATGGITNYESGDHTVTAVSVTMQEFSEAFSLTSQELQSGMRIDQLAERALMELGTDLVTTALQPLATSSYTAGSAANGTFFSASGTFGWNLTTGGDMAQLRAALGKSYKKNAILSPSFFSKLITIPVAPGMQRAMDLGTSNTTLENQFGWGLIAENTAWPTGMGAESTARSTCGFACNPQAIAVAARLPLIPPSGIPGNTLVSSTVLIPGLDMSVMLYQWFSLSTRTLWNSFGVIFGAAAGDLTAGCHVKNWQ